MHFIRLYARVLGLLAPDKWVAIGLAFSALALAGLQFLEPVLFGRVVDVPVSYTHLTLPTMCQV